MSQVCSGEQTFAQLRMGLNQDLLQTDHFVVVIFFSLSLKQDLATTYHFFCCFHFLFWHVKLCAFISLKQGLFPPDQSQVWCIKQWHILPLWHTGALVFLFVKHSIECLCWIACMWERSHVLCTYNILFPSLPLPPSAVLCTYVTEVLCMEKKLNP